MHQPIDPTDALMDDVILFVMLAAMAVLVVYVNTTDMRRRARMTKAERRAERAAEADHVRIRKS
jgi:hypothetical protein